MTTDKDNESLADTADLALWRRTTERFGAPAGTPQAEADALLLAAYLDGRLDPAELELCEARLAAEPALLELFLQSDEALGATQAVSERQLARAAKLVAGEELARPSLASRLFGSRREAGGGWLRQRAASLAATVAAVVLVSALGFEIGRFGYAVAAENYLDQGDGLAQIDAGF
jgi:anti-sigma factor RsiW